MPFVSMIFQWLEENRSLCRRSQAIQMECESYRLHLISLFSFVSAAMECFAAALALWQATDGRENLSTLINTAFSALDVQAS